jgi:hypothetical protein
MKFSKRNKLNVESRWRKIQEKDKKYIQYNKNRYLHLKARLFGYLAGDGNILIGNRINNFHHTVRFYPDHKSMVEAFCEAFIKVYGKTPAIKKLHNHYFVYMDSKIIVQDIMLSAKFGTSNWQVPYKILYNKECKKEWLRAFFDCEAYVGKDRIKIQCINKLGMKQVRRLLNEFNIVLNSYIYTPKNKNWNTNYILVIYNKEMRKKYLDLIGFNHALKLTKLKESIKIYK